MSDSVAYLSTKARLDDKYKEGRALKNHWHVILS